MKYPHSPAVMWWLSCVFGQATSVFNDLASALMRLAPTPFGQEVPWRSIRQAFLIAPSRWLVTGSPTPSSSTSRFRYYLSQKASPPPWNKWCGSRSWQELFIKTIPTFPGSRLHYQIFPCSCPFLCTSSAPWSDCLLPSKFPCLNLYFKIPTSNFIPSLSILVGHSYFVTTGIN